MENDNEKAEKWEYAPVDKGKSKVTSIFGKRKARAFGKMRCKIIKKTPFKEDQMSNSVTEGLFENEVVEATVEKSKLSRCHLMKTRKARKMTTSTTATGSSNVLPSDSAAPSSTFALPASTGNSYVLRKRLMMLGVLDLSKE
ncbi:hypothetical protein ACE6H2_024243 [Prunus campanulata]